MLIVMMRQSRIVAYFVCLSCVISFCLKTPRVKGGNWTWANQQRPNGCHMGVAMSHLVKVDTDSCEGFSSYRGSPGNTFALEIGLGLSWVSKHASRRINDCVRFCLSRCSNRGTVSIAATGIWSVKSVSP